ncbi:hypothetical protein KCP73_20100 [Salmonella enterica subsp. enterica]|nr:hypothetical protein KCP73_20100 [Salmonella enterica subsp. enterica]
MIFVFVVTLPGCCFRSWRHLFRHMLFRPRCALFWRLKNAPVSLLLVRGRCVANSGVGCRVCAALAKIYLSDNLSLETHLRREETKD